MQRLQTDLSSFRREMAREEASVRRLSVAVLDRVGRRTVEYLRSLTSEEAPPPHTPRAKWDRSRSGRLAHPGHWADRKGNLAQGYGYRIVLANGLGLEIYNDAPHAHLVEALDGFFVVSGVAERGGPVERALAQAIREIAPDWRLAA